MNISARSGPRSAVAIAIKVVIAIGAAIVLAMSLTSLKAFAAGGLTAPQLSLKCGTERTVVISNPNQVGVIVSAADKTGIATIFLAEQPLAASDSVDVVVPSGYNTISVAFYATDDRSDNVLTSALLSELATNCPPAPVDSDKDGVPDPTDKCPGTPAGEPVDSNGCSASQRDSDGDGVNDSSDKCPNAAGPASNAGCPVTPPSSGNIVWGKQGSDKASPSCLPGQATLFHFVLSGGGKIGNAGTGTATFSPSGTDSAAGEIKGAGGAAHYYVGGDYNATVTSFIVSGATWIGDKPFLKLLDSGCVGDPTPEPTPSTTDSPSPSPTTSTSTPEPTPSTTDSPSPSPVKQAVPGSGAPKTGGGGSSPVNTLVAGSVLAFGIGIGIGLVLVLGTWRRKTVRA